MRMIFLNRMDYPGIISKHILILCALLPSFVSCEQISEREKVEEILPGTWTWTQSSTSTSLWVVDDEVLFHYLIVDQGFTTEEAELLEDEILSELDHTSGTISFYQDNTYKSSVNGMEAFEGTWSVAGNGDTLIYDQGTTYELHLEILDIYSDEMNLLYPPEYFEVDLDGDEVNDITVAAFTVIRLIKS